MARLVTTGFETRRINTSAVTTSEGEVTHFVGAPTIETTIVRSGGASLLVAGASKYLNIAPGMVTNRDYWIRFYAYRTAVPSTNNDFVSMPSVCYLRIASGTDDILLNNWSDVTQQTATDAFPCDSAWHKVEVNIRVNSAADDVVQVWIDDVSVINQTVALSTSAPSAVRLGQDNAGAHGNLYIDDVAINDDQGSDQNGPCDDGRVYLLRPTVIGSGGRGNWQGGAAGTTNLHDAVDNTPPVGLSDASQTDTSAIENRNSTVPNSAEFDTQTYDDVVPSDEDVVLVQGRWKLGTSSLTGTNNGTARLFSNPDQGSDTTTSYEGAGAVANTDPAGYRTYTGPYVYNPSITRSAVTKLRVTKSESSTRAAICDFMGVLVETIPSVGGTTYDVAPLVTATSTVTVAPNRVRAVAWSANTVSTVTIAPTRIRSVVWSASSVSTVTIVVQRLKNVAPTITGTSTVEVTANRIRNTTASIDALSAVTIAVTRVRNVAWSADALSTVTIAVQRLKNVAQTVTVTSTVTIAVEVLISIASAIDSISTVTIAVTRIRNIASSIDAVSTVTITPTRFRNVAVSIAGQSTVVVDPDRVRNVSASIDGASTVTIAVQVTVLRNVIVNISSSSTVTIATTRFRNVSTSIDAVSTISIVPNRVRSIVTLITSTSSVTIAPTRIRSITALIAVTSTVAIATQRLKNVVALITGQSTVTIAVQSALGTIDVQLLIASTSSVAAAPKRIRNITWLASVQSTVTIVTARRLDRQVLINGYSNVIIRAVAPGRRSEPGLIGVSERSAETVVTGTDRFTETVVGNGSERSLESVVDDQPDSLDTVVTGSNTRSEETLVGI